MYNENDKILLYKEGATLGVTKLEYIVSTGVKQINLESKFNLEDFLKLDQLKPLSTSYTQNDNSKTETTSTNNNQDTENNNEEVEDKTQTINKEQEVNNSEEDTE